MAYEKFSVPYVGDVDLILKLTKDFDLLNNLNKLSDKVNNFKLNTENRSKVSYASRIRASAKIIGLVIKKDNIWDHTPFGKALFKLNIKSQKTILSEYILRDCEIVKKFMSYLCINKFPFKSEETKNFLKGKVSETTLRRTSVELYKIVKWALKNSDDCKFIDYL